MVGTVLPCIAGQIHPNTNNNTNTREEEQIIFKTIILVEQFYLVLQGRSTLILILIPILILILTLKL